jgi:hypothetical protein
MSLEVMSSAVWACKSLDREFLNSGDDIRVSSTGRFSNFRRFDVLLMLLLLLLPVVIECSGDIESIDCGSKMLILLLVSSFTSSLSVLMNGLDRSSVPLLSVVVPPVEVIDTEGASLGRLINTGGGFPSSVVLLLVRVETDEDNKLW